MHTPLPPNTLIPFNYRYPTSNPTGKYVWGRHHRAYLQYMDKYCGMSVKELAAACGYSNLNRLQRRRQEWATGCKPVPMKYLSSVGADIELLHDAVALDQKEFDDAVATLPLPSHVTIRLLSACYTTRQLPEVHTLEEAVGCVQRIVDEEPFGRGGACLHWQDIKTVYFKRGEEPQEVLYRPQFRLHARHVYFANPPTVGVARV